jgi:hypothetical protein
MKNIAKSPCLLIVEHDVLMSRALPSILRDTPAALKVFISHASDVQALIADITAVGADVILIGESMVFASGEPLAQVLTMCPKMRVIVADEESNWVHIFGKEDRLLAQLADLVSVIFSDWHYPIGK